MTTAKKELTLTDFEKLAALANLNIPSKHQPDLLKKMERIICFVEEMNQTDFSDIKPLSHPIDQIQPLREDQITANNQREQLQKIAPKVKDGLYIVPEVIPDGT